MSSEISCLPSCAFLPSRVSIQGFVDDYFDLNSSSMVVTALKIISYVTPIVLVMLAAQAILWCTESCAPSPLLERIVQQLSSVPLDPNIMAVIDAAPPFAGYRIGQGTLYPNTNLTAVTVRPANLFFDALLGPGSTTLPGSGQLFAFTRDQAQIGTEIIYNNPGRIVEFTAEGVHGEIRSRGATPITVPNLADLYGPATYRMSMGEIQSTLVSQEIYTAPMLPLEFYRQLKFTMLNLDPIVTLPGDDRAPIRLSELNTPNCRNLLTRVSERPEDFGFANREHWEQVSNLSLYQIGALVVKSEDFRIFLDANGKIRERHPGEQDAIRLINACGIRGIQATPSPLNRPIMTQTFRTALQAAESGFVIFPAVGMGVWGGDPDLYWRAFLDAVVASGGPMEKIFVNPNHQLTRHGQYLGSDGHEFQTILNEYRLQLAAANNTAGLANLAKIVNLCESRKDVVHLSHALKTAFPEMIVSLFNASDPDVTLGNHVGEYVNNLDHATTTEENYTAMGTNGLCFEKITGIHDSLRGSLIQARF